MMPKIMKYNYNLNNITDYNPCLEYTEHNLESEMLLTELNFIDINELGPNSISNILFSFLL